MDRQTICILPLLIPAFAQVSLQKDGIEEKPQKLEIDLKLSKPVLGIASYPFRNDPDSLSMNAAHNLILGALSGKLSH